MQHAFRLNYLSLIFAHVFLRWDKSIFNKSRKGFVLYCTIPLEDNHPHLYGAAGFHIHNPWSFSNFVTLPFILLWFCSPLWWRRWILQAVNKNPDTTSPLGCGIKSSDSNIRCQRQKKVQRSRVQGCMGQFNYCSHCLMENKPSSRGGREAVLTAASCLHDLIYEDTLLIGPRMPTLENCFKCAFAVSYLAVAESGAPGEPPSTAGGTRRSAN